MATLAIIAGFLVGLTVLLASGSGMVGVVAGLLAYAIASVSTAACIIIILIAVGWQLLGAKL